MFEKVLVAKKIELGKQLVEVLRNYEFPVTAAFWIYFEEPDEWQLIIVSPIVATQGPRHAYNLLAHAIYDLVHDPKRPFDLPMESISLFSPDNVVYKQMRQAWQEGPAVHVSGPNVTPSDTYVYFMS